MPKYHALYIVTKLFSLCFGYFCVFTGPITFVFTVLVLFKIRVRSLGARVQDFFSCLAAELYCQCVGQPMLSSHSLIQNPLTDRGLSFKKNQAQGMGKPGLLSRPYPMRRVRRSWEVIPNKSPPNSFCAKTEHKPVHPLQRTPKKCPR